MDCVLPLFLCKYLIVSVWRVFDNQRINHLYIQITKHEKEHFNDSGSSIVLVNDQL